MTERDFWRLDVAVADYQDFCRLLENQELPTEHRSILAKRKNSARKEITAAQEELARLRVTMRK